jgi:hypothetical protein
MAPAHFHCVDQRWEWVLGRLEGLMCGVAQSCARGVTQCQSQINDKEFVVLVSIDAPCKEIC